MRIKLLKDLCFRDLEVGDTFKLTQDGDIYLKVEKQKCFVENIIEKDTHYPFTFNSVNLVNNTILSLLGSDRCIKVNGEFVETN